MLEHAGKTNMIKHDVEEDEMEYLVESYEKALQKLPTILRVGLVSSYFIFTHSLWMTQKLRWYLGESYEKALQKQPTILRVSLLTMTRAS